MPSSRRRVIQQLVAGGLALALSRAWWLPGYTQQSEEDEAFLVGAQREFRAMNTWHGTILLQFGAFVYADDESAQVGFDDYAAGGPSLLEETFGVTARPASIGELGDDAAAFLGNTTIEGFEVSCALALWLDQELLYMSFAMAIGEDPFSDMLPIAREMMGRHMSGDSDATPDPVTGMRSGGVWDLLPELDQLPVGFVLYNEGLLPPEA